MLKGTFWGPWGRTPWGRSRIPVIKKTAADTLEVTLEDVPVHKYHLRKLTAADTLIAVLIEDARPPGAQKYESSDLLAVTITEATSRIVVTPTIQTAADQIELVLTEEPFLKKYLQKRRATDTLEVTLVDEPSLKKYLQKRRFSDELEVFLEEGFFPVPIREAPPAITVLDHEMQKVKDVGFDDIQEPLVIEDTSTGEHTIEFDLPVDDPDDLVESGQILLVPDEDGDLIPFNIIETGMSINAFQLLRVRGEHLFYELGDGLPRTYDLLNQTPETALANALQNTRWQVGNIDETITGLIDIHGSYENPLQMLRKIEREFQVRLKFRAEIGSKYIDGLFVDMVEIDQEFSGQRFEFEHNLAGITITVDHSHIKTALTGLVPGPEVDLTFADVEWDTGDGDPADKPPGQTWVGNEEARELYGIYDPDSGQMIHRHGVYDTGQAETAEGLLNATWLVGTRRYFRPTVNIEATVDDLSKVHVVNALGLPVILDHEKIRPGNICYVIAKTKGLLAALDVRIIRVERYLKEPERTVVIFGDPIYTGSDYFRELEEELDARTRRAVPVDRGPGACVIIGSEDTSSFPEYADIIVPASSENFQNYLAEAIDDLPEEGGQIVILEGLYQYSAQTEITKNNVTITGQGEGTVIKLADSQPTGTINWVYALDKIGIKIRDLVIDGNKENQPGEDFYSNGIYFERTFTGEEGFGVTDPNQPGWTHYYEAGLADAIYGWAFTALRDMKADMFLCRIVPERNVTLHLWDNETEEILTTASVYNDGTTFASVRFPRPVQLYEGKEYSITYNYIAEEGPATSEDGKGQIDYDEDLHDDIDFLGGVGAPGHDTFPDQFDPVYDDTRMIGYVDIRILAGYVDANKEFALRGVITRNHTAHGILIDGCYDAEISNCRSANNEIGAELLDNGLNRNVRILGCDFRANNDTGLRVTNGEHVLIENCSMIDNGWYGIRIEDIVDSAVIGNTCKQEGDAAYAGGIEMRYCWRTNVSGNVFSDNMSFGMYIYQCGDCGITDNLVNRSVYWSGMFIMASGWNKISNNNCDENDDHGIWINTGEFNIFQGNKCRSNGGYGIALFGGPASEGNMVINNDLLHNGLGGFIDDGVGTITEGENRSD